ncbi:MAG: methyltransferase domain-containing protein [Deltaproteobacteria bacterium]|nr:methyltransferase domain-containing protein [Deltaproteobacteria bacterium]
MSQNLRTQNKAYGIFDVPFLVRLIEAHKNIKSALDIGTGDGSFALEIAQKLPAVNFLAVDVNANIISQANSMATAQNIKNIAYAESFFDRNFPLKTYDLIFTKFTLQHTHDIQTFINEVHRRLNPGGLFAVIEEYWLDTMLEDKVWQGFRRFMLKTYKAFGSNPFVPRDLPSLLQKSGFANIQSSLSMNSPSTIGIDPFVDLLRIMPGHVKVLAPDKYVWEDSFLNEMEVWIEKSIRTGKIDPPIPIAHVTAQKRSSSS